MPTSTSILSFSIAGKEEFSCSLAHTYHAKAFRQNLSYALVYLQSRYVEQLEFYELGVRQLHLPDFSKNVAHCLTKKARIDSRLTKQLR